jgi:hypothetical protein
MNCELPSRALVLPSRQGPSELQPNNGMIHAFILLNPAESLKVARSAGSASPGRGRPKERHIDSNLK